MKQNIRQNVEQLLACASQVVKDAVKCAEALKRKPVEKFPKLSNKYKLKMIQFD